MSRIEYDVVLVGASPSNLTLAYRLAELATGPVRIAVLEKAKEIGGHLLSGAASNPRVIKKLFPDWDQPESGFPLEAVCTRSYTTFMGRTRWANAPVNPPTFRKEGYAILSISDLAVYMAGKIEERAKDKEGVVVDCYPGFPAREIIYDGDTVVGVKVDDTGDAGRDNLYAKVTVFGDKGFVSRDLCDKFGLRTNPQSYSVGVKEVWEVKESYEGQVWHTAGYPLEPGQLGGGFIYGCKGNRLILGMVMALDHPNPNIRPVQVLQNFKKHPEIQKMLKGGKLAKYGAAVLPEGGYYSLPGKFAVSGAMMVGDALGTLDVKRFSGVDKAMESGYLAAEVIAGALAKNDVSERSLNEFQHKLMSSWVGQELHDARYFKRAFHENPGILEKTFKTATDHIDAGKGLAAAMIFTGLGDMYQAVKNLGTGKMINSPSEAGPVRYKEDRSYPNPNHASREREPSEGFDRSTVYSTADIVFYAHTHYGEDNKHIEESSADVCAKCIATYDAAGKDTPCVGDCTAEVHETLEKDGRRVHAMALENCVQCTTCEIVCPPKNLRVKAALHGYGPSFIGM